MLARDDAVNQKRAEARLKVRGAYSSRRARWVRHPLLRGEVFTRREVPRLAEQPWMRPHRAPLARDNGAIGSAGESAVNNVLMAKWVAGSAARGLGRLGRLRSSAPRVYVSSRRLRTEGKAMRHPAGEVSGVRAAWCKPQRACVGDRSKSQQQANITDHRKLTLKSRSSAGMKRCG